MHPRAMLEAHGLKASKARGQNFLTQPASAAAIARFVAPAAEQVVVEIGPGLGALTLALAPLCRQVVAVELDRGVHAALTELLAGQGVANVELIQGDALELDWPALAGRVGGRLMVAGNLPYNLSSPLIFNLLEHPTLWEAATFLLQREFTDRLAAGPGSKLYGRLSVMVQAHCKVVAGPVLGPEQFFPQPQVQSRLVRLEPLATTAPGLEDAQGRTRLGRVVAAGFGQRRKTLLNSLAAGLGLSRDDIQAVLTAQGLDPGARAETVGVAQWAALGLALQTRLDGPASGV